MMPRNRRAGASATCGENAKTRLVHLSPGQTQLNELADEEIRQILTGGPGKQRPPRRGEGRGRKWLVCGMSVLNRAYLQDICREFARGGTSAPHPKECAKDRRCRPGGTARIGALKPPHLSGITGPGKGIRKTGSQKYRTGAHEQTDA